MTTKRKPHPLAQIAFTPRLFASSAAFVVVISILQWQLLTFTYSWLILLGLGWPHIARFVSLRAANSKRQELINMHLDALFFGLVGYTVPGFFFIATLFSVICANAMFIGSFRLLATLAPTFICAFGIAYAIQPIELINVHLAGKLAIALFILSYFSLYGTMGYTMIRRLVKLNKRVETLSSIDALTQCYNRNFLDKSLHQEILRSRRNNYPLTLIFADIDKFKAINDQLGHAWGDEILKKFASIVKDDLREEVDWVARFGGEEFLIVLPHTSIESGVIVAERIRQTIKHHAFGNSQQKVTITCSFGVTDNQADRLDAEREDLLSFADQALYSAKHNGRDQVRVYDGSSENTPLNDHRVKPGSA